MPALGQTTGVPAGNPGDTVWTTPRSRFPAGSVHRFMMGNGYRDLWSTPVPAQILDLEGFAGGLTPIKRGGGLQTRSLRLQGADGRVYNFRSLDKDAARALDPALRESVAAAVAQDFVSAILPLGAMVVDPILSAAGVLHADPRLVVMPDHPGLGEFRGEYAGLVGWLELRPDENPDEDLSFAGAHRVTGSERFMERLEESPRNRVDARGYLKARLLDALVGDWDRHPDQWRWAGFQEGDSLRFLPIPRDRDWALTRLDGAIIPFAQITWPHYVGFDFELPDPFNLSWNGRRLDRLIYPALSRGDWEAVVSEIVRALPDPVLEDAVRRLPQAYYREVGDFLTRSLKNRRDHLRAYAKEYYRLQAEWVDIHATDESELAVLERLPGDSLQVRIFWTDPEFRDPDPFFERVFHGSETREVRLDLHGEDDRARIQGISEGSIGVVLVGGGGDDTLEVATGESGERVRFYDDSGENAFRPAPRTRVEESEWEEPTDPEDDPHWAFHRDWGSRTLLLPALRFQGDAGAFMGLALTRTGYGFRHYPYRDRSTLMLAYGARTGRPHLEARTEFPVLEDRATARLEAVLTGAEVNRYYGFGNDTQDKLDEDAYEAFGWSYRVEGSLGRALGRHTWGAVGAGLSFQDPDTNAGTRLAREAPYGFRKFTSVALMGRLHWAKVDHEPWPRAGGEMEITGWYFPPLGGVEESFGKLEGSAVRYLSARKLPLGPTLALRGGGQKIWGAFPYQEAATLGGGATLMGFRQDRFAGDAAAFGNAELRFTLGELPMAFPGTWGAFILGEGGRVWYDGKSPGAFHSSVGLGLWASIIDAFTMTISVASGDEGTRLLYGGGGFHF